jgi:hypothetical protein
MSFGALFLSDDQRLQSDLSRLYRDLLQTSIRDSISPPDPDLQKKARQLGRLFNTSTDDPEVLARTHRRVNPLQPIPNQNNDSASQHETSVIKKTKPKTQRHLMNMDTTLQKLHRQPGGKYHVSQTENPYQTRLLNQPSDSLFNKDTPKMWPAQNQYPRTSRDLEESGRSLSPLPSDSICSRSVALSSGQGPSALQQTLSQCGRLVLVDILQNDAAEGQLDAAVKQHKECLRGHARWLQRKCNKPSYHLTSQTNSNATVASSSSSNASCSGASLSTMSQSVADSSWLQLDPLQTENAYDNDSSSLLEPLTSSHSLNPFRSSARQHKNVRYARRLPRPIRVQDPTDYKDDVCVRTVSSFTAVLSPSFSIDQAPSRKEIATALKHLTQKQILCYQTRVVEVGALIRGLRDSKHSTPGLQAIFALHEAMIRAAALSANPFVLSRGQLMQILSSQLPWVEEAALGRLLLAFDPTNTGFVRFVRLSCALLACFEPAMANLAIALDKASARSWKQLLGLVGSDQSRASRAPPYTEEEFKELKGELVVLRFLHRLYSECSGYRTQSPDCTGPQIEAKMSVNDISELLICGSTSPEDEFNMQSLLIPCIESLLPDSLSNGHTLQHAGLRAILGTVNVTYEELTAALLHHPPVLNEFVRQLRAFRAAAKPFAFAGSHSIEDSISLYTASRSNHVR